MILFRLILLSVIAFLLYRIYHILRLRGMPRQRDPQLDAKIMVPCALCEVHAPKDSAISHNGLWFCSEEHKQRYVDGAGN